MGKFINMFEISSRMDELKPYCIVGFGPLEAYLVQATEDKAVDVRNGLLIKSIGLRLNYINLEQEARTELSRRRARPDPRILTDPDRTLTEIQERYPLILKEADGDPEERLRIYRSTFTKDPKYFARAVRRYEEDRSLSDDELYISILTKLKSKVPYNPEPTNEIGSGDWIDNSGCVLCTIGLPSLDLALLTLYTAWESIGQDPHKKKVLEDVSNRKSNESEMVMHWLTDAAQQVS